MKKLLIIAVNLGLVLNPFITSATGVSKTNFKVTRPDGKTYIIKPKSGPAWKAKFQAKKTNVLLKENKTQESDLWLRRILSFFFLFLLSLADSSSSVQNINEKTGASPNVFNRIGHYYYGEHFDVCFKKIQGTQCCRVIDPFSEIRCCRLERSRRICDTIDLRDTSDTNCHFLNDNSTISSYNCDTKKPVSYHLSKNKKLESAGSIIDKVKALREIFGYRRPLPFRTTNDHGANAQNAKISVGRKLNQSVLPEVLRTILAHEMAHITEKQFVMKVWSSLDDYYKDYDKRRIQQNEYNERRADLLSILVTGEAKAAAEALRKITEEKPVIKHIMPGEETCSGKVHASGHPDEYTCRIPYLLRLGDKYERLNKKFTEALEQKK